MTLRTLRARWDRTDEFTDVDLVASIDEAKTLAIQYQLDHHVRAVIEWLETPEAWWGRNKFVTFLLNHGEDEVPLP